MYSNGDLDRMFARKRELASRTANTPELAQRLQGLRAWQAARLARTYEDLRRDPRHRAAVTFFLQDLYGPHDFTRRDRDLIRAWSHLRRTLPQAALEVLGKAIELEILSAELDQAMAERCTLPLTERSYANDYRAVDRADARKRQIDLILSVGADLERIVQHPWARVALRLAHVPAHTAGFGALQGFLERGFAAFRRMKGAKRLLNAIRERETQFMEALLHGQDDPSGAFEP